MNKSETIGKLAEALAKAQGQMTFAEKSSSNPHFKSRYADLAAVLDAVRAPLSSNGLAVTQLAADDEHGACVETILVHSSGEWISTKLALPVSKSDAQGYGSALTYARRYSLAAICGIAQDDDDGEAARKAPAEKLTEAARVASLKAEIGREAERLGAKGRDAVLSMVVSVARSQGSQATDAAALTSAELAGVLQAMRASKP